MHIPSPTSPSDDSMQKAARIAEISPSRDEVTLSAAKKATWLASCVATGNVYLNAVEEQIEGLRKTERSYAAKIWVVTSAGLLALIFTLLHDNFGWGVVRANQFDPAHAPVANAAGPGSWFEYILGSRLSICAAVLLLIYRLNKNRLKCHYEILSLLRDLGKEAGRLNESVEADNFAQRAFQSGLRLPGSLGKPLYDSFYPPQVLKSPRGNTND